MASAPHACRRPCSDIHQCLNSIFFVVVGVLLHSISSDDVTAVRNQSAVDMMPHDFNMARENAIHHRRRRDKAIFERDKPEPEIQTNRRARSYSMPNNMTHDYVSKQEFTNQNATVIADHAHDGVITNQSSGDHNLKSSLSAAQHAQTNNVTRKRGPRSETPTCVDGSRDTTKSNSFSSFLRKLTQLRTTSSKHATPVKLIRYTTTDDVDNPSTEQVSSVRRNVTRHQSLSTYDVSASRVHMSRPTVTPRRDIFTESKHNTSASQNDAAMTSGSRQLQRHESDLTLEKSRREEVAASRYADERHDVMSRQRHSPIMSRSTSYDVLTNKSPSVLKLAGMSSAQKSRELVRHESLSSKDNLLTSRSHELVRHKSQPILLSSGVENVTDSQGQHAKITAKQSSYSGNLVRFESLPTIAMSKNDVILSQRHDDMAASFDLSHDSRTMTKLYNEATPRSHRPHATHDIPVSTSVTLSSANLRETKPESVHQSHDIQPTMTKSHHDEVTVSRLRNSACQMTSPSTSSSDKRRLRDSDDNVMSQESRQRCNSLTSTPSSRQHLITKSSPVSTLRRSSSTTIRDQPQLTVSRYQQNDRRKSPSSSNSGSQVSIKPEPVFQPLMSSLQNRNQTNPDSVQAIPSPQRNASQTLPLSPRSVSSSNTHDQRARKPIPIPKPRALQTPTRSQTNRDSVTVTPASKDNASHMRPSSSRSTSSLSSNSQDQVTRKPALASKPHVLPFTEQSHTRSDSTKPVPTSGPRAARIRPLSPASSSSSSSKTREQVPPNSTSRPDQSSSATRGHISSDAIHSLTTSPRQHKSSQTLSLLPSSSSVALDDNDIGSTAATTTQHTDRSPTTSTDLNYHLPPPQSVALDEVSKRRLRRETAIKASINTATESELPSCQDATGHETHDNLDDQSESRSSRETANVVVVRPLPTSDHRGKDNVRKSRARRKTLDSIPIITIGSDDEDGMRSRQDSISGGSTASGIKSALRKTSRSNSGERHVSYSNTDTVYRSVSLAFIKFCLITRKVSEYRVGRGASVSKQMCRFR